MDKIYTISISRDGLEPITRKVTEEAFINGRIEQIVHEIREALEGDNLYK